MSTVAHLVTLTFQVPEWTKVPGKPEYIFSLNLRSVIRGTVVVRNHPPRASFITVFCSWVVHRIEALRKRERAFRDEIWNSSLLHHRRLCRQYDSRYPTTTRPYEETFYRTIPRWTERCARLLSAFYPVSSKTQNSYGGSVLFARSSMKANNKEKWVLFFVLQTDRFLRCRRQTAGGSVFGSSLRDSLPFVYLTGGGELSFCREIRPRKNVNFLLLDVQPTAATLFRYESAVG